MRNSKDDGPNSGKHQSGGTTYEYDLLGRLAASVGHTDVIPTYLRFTYDRLGNMLSTSLSSCGTRADNSSRCYGESTPPKSVDGTTNHFTGTAYDEAGNVTSEGLRTFTYDALGVTTGVNSIARRFRFLYTADDERLAAVELLPAGNRTTWTLRGLDNQLLRTWSDPSSTGTNVAWKEDVIRRGALLLASETSSGTRHYILDHLGSPRLVSDATGSHAQSFSPFGGGGTSDGGALQFTGHERDNAEFGDGTADLPDYMHARFYDSGAGRFLSVDPGLDIKRNLPKPQRWNRYSYALNNPIGLIDTDGRADHIPGCQYRPCGLMTQAIVDEANQDSNDAVEAASGMGPGATPGERAMGVAVLGLMTAKYVVPFFVPGEGVATQIAENAAKGDVLAALRSGAGELTVAQRATVIRQVQRATTSESVSVVRNANGTVSVLRTRPGADGSQTFVTSVGRTGLSQTVQTAQNAAGEQVHYDPKGGRTVWDVFLNWLSGK